MKFPWALLLLLLVLILLIAQRYYYLVHFGFVYTDGDQSTFWYQADEIAHGIFREPCLYGQRYNFPLESWLAAPLILLHVPAYIALPLVATALGALPFFVLSVFAYLTNHRWMASAILLIPVALPLEYTIVSSLPRGFINGLAVATPALVCWIFYDSGKAFFLGAFFAVLGMSVNPNCSIVLIAAAVFALLTHHRLVSFYLCSILGALAAAPAPLFIALFYKWHPECDAYYPKASFVFTWERLKNSLFVHDQIPLTLNHAVLDLFFAHFIPILRQGWIILCVLAVLFVLLLLAARFRSAIAFLLATAFTIFSLGIERIHMADDNVFYSGSRMFLALPVMIAMGLLWFDIGMQQRWPRWLAASFRSLLIAGLLACGCYGFFSDKNLLDSPSPFVVPYTLPPVEPVDTLVTDSRVLTEACKRYHADLVLIGQSYLTCMDDAGPVLSGHAFQTLSPFFERRTYRIKEERTRLHTRVIVYLPTQVEIFLATSTFLHARLISDSPQLLLVETAAPGLPGMDIAGKLGILYREKM